MGNKKNLAHVLDTLIELTAEILEYRGNLAMGKDPPPGHEMYSAEEQLRILDIMKPIIQNSRQTQKIDAESVQDVLDLLKRGEITIDDAHTLMGLIKLKSDVEESETQAAIQKKLLEMMP